MRAGALRHRVEIQRPAQKTDRAGRTVLGWDILHPSIPADVRQLSGRELFEAQAVYGRVSYEVHLRWMEGITPKDRLMWEGKALQIQSTLNPDGRRRELVLLCEGEAA